MSWPVNCENLELSQRIKNDLQAHANEDELFWNDARPNFVEIGADANLP